MNFDVLHAATINSYADGDFMRLVNLGPIGLFSDCMLTTNSEKHLEDISHAHIVSLFYKLLTSSGGSDELSFRFDRERGGRLRQFSNNKNQNGKYHVRIYFKKVFGFAEHQVKATFGLGYKLTLTRNTDNSVLNNDNATNIVKIRISAI